MAKDPKFSTLLARKENEEELDRITNEWTMKHTAEDVMNKMQKAGVAAGVVETGEDLMDKDPQLKARGFFHELEYPGIGTYRISGRSSLPFVEIPLRIKTGPLMGEHNDYVFKGLLGMPDDEFDKLVKEGVID